VLCFTMSHMGTCSGEPEGRQKIQFPETFPNGTVPHQASRPRSGVPRSECDAVLLTGPPPETGNSASGPDRFVHLGPGAPNSLGYRLTV